MSFTYRAIDSFLHPGRYYPSDQKAAPVSLPLENPAPYATPLLASVEQAAMKTISPMRQNGATKFRKASLDSGVLGVYRLSRLQMLYPHSGHLI
jgi:hypothetical protein